MAAEDVRAVKEVDLTSFTRVLVLLDEWIRHARDVEVQLERMTRKYQAAHERCEQLREIVREDYPGAPF